MKLNNLPLQRQVDKYVSQTPQTWETYIFIDSRPPCLKIRRVLVGRSGDGVQPCGIDGDDCMRRYDLKVKLTVLWVYPCLTRWSIGLGNLFIACPGICPWTIVPCNNWWWVVWRCSKRTWTDDFIKSKSLTTNAEQFKYIIQGAIDLRIRGMETPRTCWLWLIGTILPYSFTLDRPIATTLPSLTEFYMWQTLLHPSPH